MMISVLKYFELRNKWFSLYQRNDIENIQRAVIDEMLEIDDQLLDFEKEYRLVSTRYEIKTGTPI